MKSKLAIVGFLLSSLLAVSVNGQKIGPTQQQVILQDDRSADHLLIVLSTGEYTFESCKGSISTGGVGKVSVTGCKVVLQDMSETRRVLAEVDLCERVGKADIAFVGDALSGRIDPPTFEFIISDSNTGDSTLDCQPKPIVGK